MHSSTIEQRHERSHTAAVATARGWPRSVRRGCTPRSRSTPGRWGLVRVWDGAVLARFDSEASARAAMSGADDDEVVVLHLGT